ncbi:hypothetical protein O6H91_06G062400 [Diphasiastrum complanatum]|nr:hypothetical protein O6H91_06G062400 [Diphasiastrum complanatum]
MAFLWDAVFSVGKNLYKYLDQLHSILSAHTLQEVMGSPTRNVDETQGLNSPEFGPFVVCVLDKYNRIIRSDSKGFKLPERAAISVYLAYVLDTLLQAQANPKTLAVVICSLLSGDIFEYVSQRKYENNFSCEWGPLSRLYGRAESLCGKSGSFSHRMHLEDCELSWDSSDSGQLMKVLEACAMCQEENSLATAKALACSLLCTCPLELLKNFPWVLGVCQHVFLGDFSVLAAILNANRELMSEVICVWPGIYGLERAATDTLEVPSNGIRGRKFFYSLIRREQANQVPSQQLTVFAASGFASFLKSWSFFGIFPAAASSNNAKLLTSSCMINYIQSSLLRLSSAEIPLAVRVLSFWIEQLLRIADVGEVEKQLETCFMLLKQIILPFKGSSWWEQKEHGISFFKELITNTFTHPMMYEHFLFHERAREKQSSEEIWSSLIKKAVSGDEAKENAEDILCTKSKFLTIVFYLHPLDRLLVQILKEFLSMCWYPEASALFSWNEKHIQSIVNCIQSSCRPLIARAFDTLRNQLQEEITSNKQCDLLPVSALYAVLELAPHIEPFHLVSFLQDFFSQYTYDNSVDNGEISLSKQSLGLHLAKTLFEMFSSSSRKWENSMKNSNWWSLDQVGNHFSLTDLIPIFENVLKLFLANPSDTTASCVLSALGVMDLKHDDDIPYYIQLSVDSFPDFVAMIPVEILRVCMQNTTELKAKLVLVMIGASPIHFSEFGRLIALTVVDKQHSKLMTYVSLSTVFMSVGQLNHEVGSFSLSNNDLRLLLPAAHYYLTCSKRPKVMITSKTHNLVRSVYRRFLIRLLKKWDKEFNVWGRSILSDGFLGGDQFLASQRAYLFSEKTLVGKALAVLHDCLLFQPLTDRKRHSLFCHLLPKEDKILINGLNSTSLGDLKIAVINTVARSTFLLLLLSNNFFSPLRDAVTHNVLNMEADSDVLLSLKGDSKIIEDLLTYVDHMVYLLDVMYQSKLLMDSSGELKHNVTRKFSEDNYILIIEESVLTYLLIVSKYMELVQRDEKFVHLLKSFTLIVLRHRFGDYLPTITLRCLFSCLRPVELPILASANKLAETAMELAVTHSQFVPLLFSKNHSSVKGLQVGGSHTALTSILGLVSFSETYIKAESLSAKGSEDRVGIYQENDLKEMNKEVERNEIACNGKLQLVKLLRVLYSLRCRGIVSAASSIASDELLSLLLIAYTASMSEVDQEIFSLMHEIESSEGAGFAGLSGLDYLWGEAAFKRRNARMKEKQDVNSLDVDSIEEVRKRMVKEDLVIDPRKCGLTVLHFPTKRSTWIPACEPKLEYEVGLIGKPNAPMEGNLGAMLYDPAFILPFSLYGLSTNSIDVEDFINWGLLAIAFASTSSISNELRKLGYEVLSTLMRNLKEGLSFKGKSQIQLLLIFFKNAITEPWQRIPNIFAVFSAEASYILMHPENPHYLTINRFLLREPGMDLENVPLFQKLFGSGSMHFRSERIWMLNLLTAGLTSTLDTRICRRQFLLEILMSFFSSTISDGSTRKQILQVVKRAAKVPSYALYLVDTAGLLSWLASVAVNKLVFRLGEHSGADVYEESTTAIQVIEILLTCRRVEKWALTEGMEELSKVAIMLHRYLIGNSESAHQHISFKRPVLRIMMTVLRLSQRQKRYQIRFSLSLCGMQEIIRWVEVKRPDDLQAMYETRIVALWTLLQTSPPSVSTRQEKEVFCFVLWWATMVIMLVVQKNSITPLLPTLTMQNASSSEEKLDVSRLSEVLLRWTSRALLVGRLVAQTDRGPFSSRTEKFESLGSFIMSFESKTSPFDGSLARLVLLLHKVSHAQSGGSLEPTVNALASLLPMNQLSSLPVVVRKDRCFGLEKISDASHEVIDNMLPMLLAEIPCPQEANFLWRWSVCSPWEERLQAKALESSLFYEYEVRKIVLSIYQQICTLGSYVPHSLSNWKASRHLFSENRTTLDIEDELVSKDVTKKISTLKVKLSQLVS